MQTLTTVASILALLTAIYVLVKTGGFQILSGFIPITAAKYDPSMQTVTLKWTALTNPGDSLVFRFSSDDPSKAKLASTYDFSIIAAQGVSSATSPQGDQLIDFKGVYVSLQVIGKNYLKDLE